MTTTVKVEAHCDPKEKEVFVQVTGQPYQTLQDGESCSEVVYGNLEITVYERSKGAEKACVRMTFGEAIQEIKAGRKVWREGWNGKGMYIFIVKDGAWDFDTRIKGIDEFEPQAFVCMKTAQNTLIPWLASQMDILSEDWISDRVY